MSATEELRRLLDERGVEWRDGSDENVLHTTWNNLNCWFNEFPDGWTSWGMSMRGTPEQAIAATLGRPIFDANLEQALSFMRIWISDDAHLGDSELSAAFEKAEGLRKLDAIESAIAATLGQAERTCKLDYERHCSNCGVHVHKSAVLVRKDLDGGAWTVVSKPANYCPNCGAKVVDA